jgi:hypothetical protein
LVVLFVIAPQLLPFALLLLLFSVLTSSSNAAAAVAAVVEEDQLTQRDVIGWAVTAIAVAIAGISLWHNAKATRESHKLTSKSLELTAKAMELDAKSRYLEFVMSLHEDLGNLEADFVNRRPGSTGRHLWEGRYLNAVDNIALLIHTLQIPEEITDYFRDSFSYARHIIEEGTPDTKLRAERVESYREILQICRRKGWEPRNEDAGAI